MKEKRPLPVAGAVGLCLLCGLLLPSVRPRPGAGPDPDTMSLLPATSRWSPSKQARIQGFRFWTRAQMQVGQELNQMAERGPERNSDLGEEFWRRQLMARDRSGSLRRARAAVRRAASLARTSDEAYEAALMLTRLECDAGHHRAELRQARYLMALAAQNPLSRKMLRHAAACNGLSLPAPGEMESREMLRRWRLAEASMRRLLGDRP